MKNLLSYVYGLGAIAGLMISGALITRARRLECSPKFFPGRLSGGARSPERIHLIVIHSTESTGTGAAVASYFQSSGAFGSTQLIAGEDGIYRSVDDLKMPAGAPGANEDGLHIEIVGLAKWTRAEWLARAPKAIEYAARAVAEWGHKYKIPLAYVNAEAIKGGKARGVTTHNDVSKAFKKSDHWDPGPGFPMDVLLEKARNYA